jgi:hypothetical protein
MPETLEERYLQCLHTYPEYSKVSVSDGNCSGSRNGMKYTIKKNPPNITCEIIKKLLEIKYN